jgi:hypothetical protein
MADTTKVETTGTSSGALDAPTDLSELVVTSSERYHEDNENHVPNPLYSTGTLDTSDTAGAADNSIREVSPVFEAARAANLVAAAKALDPDDATPAELVVLPQGSVTVTGSVRTADEAREEIAASLRALKENPVELGGVTPAQQSAAEENEDADAEVDTRASSSAPVQQTRNPGTARKPR